MLTYGDGIPTYKKWPFTYTDKPCEWCTPAIITIGFIILGFICA